MAVMRDMGSGIREAVTQVFPRVLQLVCHYHFLRNMGKDILMDMHTRLKKVFTSRKITSKLRRLQRRLYPMVISARGEGDSICWTPMLLVYVAISWVLGYPRGYGYGIPFNLPYNEYYGRCVKAREWVMAYIRLAATEYKTYPELLELKGILDAVVDTKGDDLVVHGLYREMEKVWGWFSELRRILRLKGERTPLSGGKKTTDEELEATIREMRGFMKKLRDEVHRCDGKTRIRIRMILQALDNHWNELFASNPISPNGDAILLPRTNNLMERGYRRIKRGVRRRTGRVRTGRDVVLFGQGLEMVSNLENPIYRKYVLGSPDMGVMGLCKVFAEVDTEQLNSLKSELTRMRKGMDVLPIHDDKKLRVLAEGLIDKAAKLGVEPPTLSWFEQSNGILML